MHAFSIYSVVAVVVVVVVVVVAAVVVVVMVHNNNGECTRAQSLTRPCPSATCNWFLHPAPTSAQDGLDPMQLALVVFFLLAQLAKRPHLLMQWALLATCTGVFSLHQLVHLLMCTHDLQPCYHRPLPFALVVFFLYRPGI